MEGNAGVTHWQDQGFGMVVILSGAPQVLLPLKACCY